MVDIHSDDMSQSSYQGFDNEELHAGGLHTIQNLQVGDTVLPTDSKDGAESMPVKISLLFDVELRFHINLEKKGYSQLCRFYLCCDMNVVLNAHSST